ncbi:MAG: ATP phosphoribosyltransferase regulatory subunit [Gammaproteobacteria bacterium]|nr:ATP phosphoribosyltransferase regulatory subunit [Gammaproteobacteria bacterium]
MEVLEQAKHVLSKASDQVQHALRTLQTMVELMAERLPDIAINFDLAELRGYHSSYWYRICCISSREFSGSCAWWPL